MAWVRSENQELSEEFAEMVFTSLYRHTSTPLTTGTLEATIQSGQMGQPEAVVISRRKDLEQ